MLIEKVYLSGFYPGIEKDEKLENEYTDVIVVTDQGNKYVASFFTFENINMLRHLNHATGEFLGGKYFWANNMVLVDSCSKENIEKVVNHINDEGNFTTVFRRL